MSAHLGFFSPSHLNVLLHTKAHSKTVQTAISVHEAVHGLHSVSIENWHIPGFPQHNKP